MKTTFTPEQRHQGFRGMLHGGLMMTMLDEALAWYASRQRRFGMTSEQILENSKP